MDIKRIVMCALAFVAFIGSIIWWAIATESYLILAAFVLSMLMAFSAFYQEVIETEYYESLKDEL